MSDPQTPTENAGDNFFQQFVYDSWTTTELQQLYPTLESALSALETQPNAEAAMVACWKLFERADPDLKYFEPDMDIVQRAILKNDPGFLSTDDARSRWEGVRVAQENINRGNREHIPNQLADLVRRLEPHLVLDEPVSEREVLIFGHVSAALAVCLERLDRGQTERFWEVVDKALVFFKRPAVEGSPAWYEETEFSLDLATSRRLVEALLRAKSFHRHYLDASYQRALECLFEASKRCLEEDNELYDCAFPGSPRIDDWIILEKGGPAILSAGAGFQLIAYTVPAQKAVEAFDHLTTDSPVDINWDEVPIWCMAISDIWEEPTPNPDVRSNTSRFHHTARDFWVMAHGIALQKMTPDALVRALEASKAADSEKRLSMYFFPGLWNSLPEKARKALISADREYEHLHSRRPIIFDHLRHAARAIIDERLWIPFQAFLRSKGSLHSDLGEAARDEPDLSRMLDNWASPEFEGYLVNRYRTQDVSYIRNLQWPLRRLNYLANTASHEHWRGLGEFEQALREGYAKFLGIGQLGILPKLVRLLAYGRVHEPRIP